MCDCKGVGGGGGGGGADDRAQSKRIKELIFKDKLIRFPTKQNIQALRQTFQIRKFSSAVILTIHNNFVE